MIIVAEALRDRARGLGVALAVELRDHVSVRASWCR
jgi:hypothetical protein